MQLRCPGRVHGVFVSDDRIEIKCHSSHCGARKGTTVLHYFDRESGELMETRKFKEPKDLFPETKEVRV